MWGSGFTAKVIYWMVRKTASVCGLGPVVPHDFRLAKAQELPREDDTVVVWELDRLDRSFKHLVDLVGELHRLGVQFKSLTDAIDTGTASGHLFFHVIASLAEMERELAIEKDLRRPRCRTPA